MNYTPATRIERMAIDLAWGDHPCISHAMLTLRWLSDVIWC